VDKKVTELDEKMKDALNSVQKEAQRMKNTNTKSESARHKSNCHYQQTFRTTTSEG
jgi:hypothetical protein